MQPPATNAAIQNKTLMLSTTQRSHCISPWFRWCGRWVGGGGVTLMLMLFVGLLQQSCNKYARRWVLPGPPRVLKSRYF